jgi:hypothetical protein
MPTMEIDNDGHWTHPDPDKCLECKRARECPTKFFYLDREYSKDGDHCECGHLSQALGATEEEEAKAAGRLPHTKLCSDHFIAIWERLRELQNLESSPSTLDRTDE